MTDFSAIHKKICRTGKIHIKPMTDFSAVHEKLQNRTNSYKTNGMLFSNPRKKIQTSLLQMGQILIRIYLYKSYKTCLQFHEKMLYCQMKIQFSGWVALNLILILTQLLQLYQLKISLNYVSGDICSAGLHRDTNSLKGRNFLRDTNSLGGTTNLLRCLVA